MKSKKWLFVIVAVVFFLNISFYSIIHLGKVNVIVKDKITSLLSETMNAEVKIGTLTFNDRNLKVTDFYLKKSDEITLTIEQLYIDYNLFKLLFSRFKNLEAIKHIKIHQPQITMNIINSQKKNNFEIPDMSKFFKLLNIYNGSFFIIYEKGEMLIESELSRIELSIKNKKRIEINLSCEADSCSQISAKTILKKNKIESATLNIFNYFPKKLELQFIDELSATIDLSVNYQSEKLDYLGEIKSVLFEKHQKKAKIDTISFSGNKSFATFNFDGFIFDNEPINFNAKIMKPFSEDRSMKGFSQIHNLNISKYIPNVDGLVSIDAEFSGDIVNPIIEAEITSEQITSAEMVIKNVKTEISYYDKKTLIDLIHCFWEENKITGTGTYNLQNGFDFNLVGKKIFWQKNQYQVSADFFSTIKFVDEIEMMLNLKNLKIESDNFMMNDFEFSGKYLNDKFQFLLNRPQNDFEIFGEGSANDFVSNVKMRRFNLSDFYKIEKQLPTLTGKIELKKIKEKFIANSRVRAYGKNFGELDGLFNSKIVIDKNLDSTYFWLKSNKARYNYETIKIDIEAIGNLDSISTTNFVINDEIKIDSWIKLKPKIKYGIQTKGNAIKLKNIFQYFTDYYTKENIKGTVDFDLYYNNLKNGKAQGSIKISDFKYDESPNLNTEIKIVGDNQKIVIENMEIHSEKQEVLTLNSTLNLQPNFELQISGITQSLNLNSLFGKKFTGNIDGGFEFNKKANSQSLSFDLMGDSLKINKLKIDELKIFASQLDKLLKIDTLHIQTKNLFGLNMQGAIGYNIFNKTTHPDTSSINIQLSGDPLKVLSKLNKTFSSGKSNCDISLKLAMEEEGLSFKSGLLFMKNGKISIKNQAEKIDDLDIELKIVENILSIEKFRIKMGEGKLYIKNEITDSDFKLGLLNLGKFQTRTNEKGILLNIPKYTPKNSFIRVAVKGRDNKYLQINGPFEDVKIIGNLEFSDGSAIYPTDTENLLKVFNIIQEKKKKAEPLNLPFNLDIMLNFGENIRYVTFPADIELGSNCYLHLKYENNIFIIPDAFFNSEKGSVDMFGTKLLLDNLQIQMNKFEKGANISGLFFKKATDGTIITLQVYNDNERELKFNLSSDNPNDTVTDILAKLRYNRNMDEISPDQKKTLMQDEFIQIAGIGLESAVLTPLLSPIENWIRRLFMLDYFQLQTGFVQNIITNYSSQKEDFITENQILDQFTADVFLNNLSINFGKYISNKVFFDYKVRFEKPIDISLETDFGVFHEFVLRYNLPYKFNVSYRYNILPFEKEDSHEIMLEKSFQFGNFITPKMFWKR